MEWDGKTERRTDDSLRNVVWEMHQRQQGMADDIGWIKSIAKWGMIASGSVISILFGVMLSVHNVADESVRKIQDHDKRLVDLEKTRTAHMQRTREDHMSCHRRTGGL